MSEPPHLSPLFALPKNNNNNLRIFILFDRANSPNASKLYNVLSAMLDS